MENKDLNRYDTINTTAVRWLKYYSDKEGKPLCFKDFYESEEENWLMEMFRNYSLFNGYCDYYVKTDFLEFLYLKIFGKHKHLKLYRKKKDVAMIDPVKFIAELLVACGEKNLNVIKDIYNCYYRR